MRTYITKRLLLIVPTLLGVATLVFFIMRVIPGDVTLLILGGDQAGRIDPARSQPCGTSSASTSRWWCSSDVAVGRTPLRLRHFALDRAAGDQELLIRLPLSLELALLASMVSVLIAIPLGMLAAVRQDSWVDYVVRVVSIGGLAIPSFWVGILCILLLVIYFGWGPPLEFTPPWVDPWANFQQMVWPVVTVGTDTPPSLRV